MTNREVMIKALQDDFDDWGYTESVIAYNIACPHYSGDENLPCDGMTVVDTLNVCGPCKLAWLDEESK